MWDSLCVLMTHLRTHESLSHRAKENLIMRYHIMLLFHIIWMEQE